MDVPKATSPRSAGLRVAASPRNKATVVITNQENTLKGHITRAKNSEACLVVMHGTPIGHRYFLDKDEMVIGRDPAVHICLSDQTVSRRHATVTKADGTYKLTDLGGPNGTFINDAKVSKGTVVLTKDTLIKMGNTLLKFLPSGEADGHFFGSLSSAAHLDSLTRIMNKGHFMTTLESKIDQCEDDELSLLFVDIDLFKVINDTHGHDAGDFVLRELCQVVNTSHVRNTDIFARYGGEEFVLMLPKTAMPAALEIAEQLRAGVMAHGFVYEGTQIKVTVSIGVAQLSEDVATSAQLIKAADKALYRAKSSGRNKVVSAPPVQ